MLDFATCFVLAECFAFVLFLFSAAQADEHLGLPSLEVELERDECQPPLESWHGEFGDLLLVEEQFARTFRFVVEAIGLDIFLNIAADQPDFSIADTSVGFFQRGLASAEALDFAPDQHNATFERVENGVVVASLSVLSHHAFIGVRSGRLLFLSFLGHAVEASGAKIPLVICSFRVAGARYNARSLHFLLPFPSSDLKLSAES